MQRTRELERHHHPTLLHPPPQSLQLTQSSSSHVIPTIDLSRHRSETIQQIHHASHNWGFFQVIHHDIPISVLDNTISAVQSFKELPVQVKSQHYRREIGSGVSF
ncbi:1-aminocyclopropane-1-carboxylate oxidase 3-like protein [Cinnamomum micranthum f. kanehirae]|uniref:1-aminocyclopropane-1-carboxylate oxidase 3-like protein n=1 Tax=Cinnamomum micranthum f. kanehirae TaxID=337451 RepID=A0A3S3NIQ1_9MAGN|nr:1-aminocyclopropane-1-carboxylate oxidase 3-like protein [Cinnamomum micranthum f. kanehirae]